MDCINRRGQPESRPGNMPVAAAPPQTNLAHQLGCKFECKSECKLERKLERSSVQPAASAIALIEADRFF
jgi:hypothetical protein